MKTGHIEIIDNEVNFVYYELKIPKKSCSEQDYLIRLMEEYETSKRSVKVSNVRKEKDGNYSWTQWWDEGLRCVPMTLLIKDNQPCKAEVNGTATIIELTKE